MSAHAVSPHPLSGGGLERHHQQGAAQLGPAVPNPPCAPRGAGGNPVLALALQCRDHHHQGGGPGPACSTIHKNVQLNPNQSGGGCKPLRRPSAVNCRHIRLTIDPKMVSKFQLDHSEQVKIFFGSENFFGSPLGAPQKF